MKKIEKKYKIGFCTFLVLVITLLTLIVCCYIPRSWGYQGVRDFFDMVSAVSGSGDNPTSIAWMHLEVYFVFACYFLVHFYCKWKRRLSFYSMELPKKKLLMHWEISILLGMLFIFISNYIQYITYFM